MTQVVRTVGRLAGLVPPWLGRPGGHLVRGLLLRRNPSFFRAVVDGTSALLLVLDEEGRIVVANAAVLRCTGWSAADLVGERFVDVLAVPEEAALAEEAIADSFETGTAHPQEGEWLDRQGGRRRVAMQNSMLRDRHDRAYAYVSIGVDVTQRRREEAALRQRADTDLLTGLRNRGAFFAALDEALAGPDPGPSAAGSVGLLFCDLDGFKQANDSHGHAAGDSVLVEVAARLRRVAGAGGVVARIGGDEFVLLLRPADDRRLATAARAVEEAVRSPFRVGDAAVRLGVSVGTALAWAGAIPDELVAAADREMYAVKSRRHRPRSRSASRGA